VWRAVTPHARVRDVGNPGQILGCVVAIEKARDEDAAAALRAALDAHRWMKFVIVVDADVNVHDAEEVMWAIHTRFSPERGVLRVAGTPGFPRADVAGLHVGKLGIDATYPVAMKAKFARRRFPGIENIDLAAYLGDKFGRLLTENLGRLLEYAVRHRKAAARAAATLTCVSNTSPRRRGACPGPCRGAPARRTLRANRPHSGIGAAPSRRSRRARRRARRARTRAAWPRGKS